MKYLFPTFLCFILFSCGENKTADSTEITTNPKMEKQYIYVGTYTKKEGHVDGKGKGIYSVALNKSTDSLNIQSVETKSFEAVNPSYITIAPDKKYLYAVHELNPNDGDSGTVGAYRIDEVTKELHSINQQKTHNYAPCHIVVDATQQLAFVTNYVGGIVCVYPILKNGSLGEASQIIELKGKGTTGRQEGSHPHSTTISPDNKFAFVSDLGTDKIMTYKIDFENKKLIPTEQGFLKIQDGAGPRHFAFHPNENIAYVVNELDATVNTFDYEKSTGQLTQKQSVSTLPQDFSGANYCADIHVHPSGDFVYASNRGHNSIAIFKVEKNDGTLTLIGTESTQGDFPRNFNIEPSGKYLWVANQNSDNILKFKIDPSTGKLTNVGEIKIPTPVCLKFL